MKPISHHTLAETAAKSLCASCGSAKGSERRKEKRNIHFIEVTTE